MGSLLLFFLLISSGSFFVAAQFNRKYEETLPLTIFSAVQIVFLFGLFDNLELGTWIICAIAIFLYAFGIWRIVQKKKLQLFCHHFFSPAFFIFTLLLILYAFCIVGRVAYKGDEFSFWASSVKKMYHLNAFHCLPAAEPYFAEYPPGMQIFEYILQVFHGSFSEWRLNFAYITYIFALLLLAIKGERRQLIKNLLLVCVLFSCTTIVISDGLDNLMVDLALGATFAFGMARVFLLKKFNNKWDLLGVLSVIMCANMLILIKSAGKLFAVLLLVALGCVLLGSPRKWKTLFSSINRKWILFASTSLIPLATALLWHAKYTYYETHVSFDVGAYNISEFLSILSGENCGYRSAIKDSFFNFMVQEPLKFGFLSLSNLQFVLLLVALILLLLHLQRDSVLLGSRPAVVVLLACGPIYWLGMLASYMYTFTEQEGTALASMQRYLNIYNVAILLFALILLLNYLAETKFGSTFVCCLLVLVLSFSSMSDIQHLLTREAVSTSIKAREASQNLVDQIKADPTPVQEELPTVLLIYKGGVPHIPVNMLTYSLWPTYQVPWECSFGSTIVFEGDVYTQIFSAEEFQAHVSSLGVDYIAIEALDADFVNTYGTLFSSSLSNGQIYKVSENMEFILLVPQS